MTAPPPSDSSSSNVRVVARIRPLSSRELERGSKEIITSLPQTDPSKPAVVQVRSQEKRFFELDAVFGPDSSQESVYEQSGAQTAVCDSLFKGFNCTILAYGQTGAGKSFSMGTAQAGSLNDTDGIIPRACHDLFQAIQEKCDGNATVELSYLELYNEEIRDLFADDNKNGKLAIRETLSGEVYVSGTVSKTVASPEEIGKLMEHAASKRVVASTAMNAVSSRSHAICTLRIQGILEGPEGTDKFTSKLTLVDLAGSERIKKTGAQGARQAEGININKSLLILGQVVSALSQQGRKRAPKPPYRDSKLTRLLQDSLGGNSRTIMIACISPADFNMDESVNTLRYATSARNIKNKATRNLVTNISQEEAMQLKRDNQLLQAQVKELQEMLKKMTVATKREPPSRTNSSDSTIVETDTSSDTLEEKSQPRSSSEPVSEDAAKEIASLKKQLQAAQEEARLAIEIPALHMEIAQLKVKAADRDTLLEENENLERELEETKEEARSSRRAAAQLSDVLDKLEELKRDEIEEKAQSLEQVRKERHWISFVHVMLENYRLQVGQLEQEFSKKVVQAIENLEFTENEEKIKQMNEERQQQQQRVQRRRSWWGGAAQEDAVSNEVLPWVGAVGFFKGRLFEVKEMIGTEAESLKSMQKTLDSDVKTLERELKQKKVEFETMESRPIERESAVKEISAMLSKGPDESFDIVEMDGSESNNADFDRMVQDVSESETENEDPTATVTATLKSMLLEES